jgi:hypothetical protein
MFAFFRNVSGKKSSRRSSRRFRLETLESRNCPSAVTLSFEAQTITGHNVAVQGCVMGPEGASYQVSFSGPVSGGVALDSCGDFYFAGPATGLGTITGTATDSAGDTAQATADIADPPPQITALQVSATGQGKQVDISGSVQAMSPGGLTVTLAGSAGVNAGATTDANGSFNLVTTATKLGDVSAFVTDVWGVASQMVTTTLTVQPPQVSGLTAVELGNGCWEFQGSVMGPDAADDSLQLSGVASASGAADSSGSFSVIVQAGSTPFGTEYVVATDAWGQTSNQASYTFTG